MRSLYIASTGDGGGKTTVAVGLGLALRRRGLAVGYFKPVGVASRRAADPRVDDDAALAAEVLELDESLDEICPVVLGDDLMHEVLGGGGIDAMGRVRSAYERLAAGKDLVICEGLGEVWQGRFLHASGLDIVRRLELRTLLVARYAGARLLDDVLYVRDVLEERLAGVVFTVVPTGRLELVEREYATFLAAGGIECLGLLAADSRLSAVTVADIALALGGTYVSGEEHADTAVESYLVGAMSPEHALRYFERTAGKAVVVGGDRAEVVLAALETSTAAVVLTGGHVPGAAVLARAQEHGVPVVSVADDTGVACEGIRRLFGRLGVHGRRKVDLIETAVSAALDVERLQELLTD